MNFRSLFSKLGEELSEFGIDSFIKNTFYASWGYNPNHRELTPEEKLKAIAKQQEQDSNKSKEKEKSQENR